MLIPLGQALVAIPFVVRAMLPTLRAIDPDLRARGGDARRVPERGPGGRSTCRCCAAPLGVGAGFAFAISLGEFGATSSSPARGQETLPIAIGRLLGRPASCQPGAGVRAHGTILLAADDRGRPRRRPPPRGRGPQAGDDARGRRRARRLRSSGARPCSTAVSLRVDGGEIVGPARAVRVGQEHAAARDRRPARPDVGRVCWDGADLTDTPDPPAPVRLGVPGRAALPPSRRRRQRRLRDADATPASSTRSARRVDELLALVGLDGLRAAPGHRPLRAARPSGSPSPVRWRRRRAVLLLDEPLTGLDRDLHDRLALDLRRVLTEVGITAIHVTHDLDEATTVADRIVTRSASCRPRPEAGVTRPLPSSPVRVRLPRHRADRHVPLQELRAAAPTSSAPACYDPDRGPGRGVRRGQRARPVRLRGRGDRRLRRCLHLHVDQRAPSPGRGGGGAGRHVFCEKPLATASPTPSRWPRWCSTPAWSTRSA